MCAKNEERVKITSYGDRKSVFEQWQTNINFKLTNLRRLVKSSSVSQSHEWIGKHCAFTKLLNAKWMGPLSPYKYSGADGRPAPLHPTRVAQQRHFQHYCLCCSLVKLAVSIIESESQGSVKITYRDWYHNLFFVVLSSSNDALNLEWNWVPWK